MSSHGDKRGDQYQRQSDRSAGYISVALGAPSHYQYGHQQSQNSQHSALSNYDGYLDDNQQSNEGHAAYPEMAKHPLNEYGRLWKEAPQVYSHYPSSTSSSSPLRSPISNTTTTERRPEHDPSRGHTHKETEIDDSDGLNSQLAQLPLDPEIVKEMSVNPGFSLDRPVTEALMIG
jgi:hypothetical protein